MFSIDKHGTITISMGDSCTFSTEFYIDGSETPHKLSGNECVIFTVKTVNSQNLKIKRELNENSYNENGELLISISAWNTKDMPPAEYEYSFLYIPDKTTPMEAYTYAQGTFKVIKSVTTIDDLEVLT